VEIQEFHGLVAKNLERAIAAFAANDRTLAQEVLDQRAIMRQRERDLRESHIGRLRAGLDISEHGMYGSPEAFIPAPELIGFANAPGSRDIPRRVPSTQEVPAT
jgi:hypothetical protein